MSISRINAEGNAFEYERVNGKGVIGERALSVSQEGRYRDSLEINERRRDLV